MTDHNVDLLILGAGIAGLGASFAARERGLPAVILEKGSSPGGILNSFSVDGFLFDNGVHLSFASEKDVRAIFDQTEYFTHPAESVCRDQGLWLKHPVQNNMYPLSVEEKVKLIEGLVNAPSGPILNYRDWLIQQYGLPIAERWPLTYTKKYWTVDAKELGTDWVGPRMRRADLCEVLRGAMEPTAPNTYYLQEMRYPKAGGYKSFIEPLIRNANVHCDQRVVLVDPASRLVKTEDGSTYSYKRLVSTIPLPEMVSLIPQVPTDIRSKASSLFASQVDLVSVGLKGPDTAPALWFYVYDKDVFASRVYSPTRKSPSNAPDGYYSFQFEIYSSKKLASPPTSEVISNCLDAIEKFGLGKKSDVVLVHHKKLPYANVVFDVGMESRRDDVVNWLNSQQISVAGRFGEWAYLWSNQSYISGRKAVLDL